MQRVKANDARGRQIFIRIKRPRRLEFFTKLFFILLDQVRRQIVFAVDCVLNPEVVQNNSQEIPGGPDE